MLQCMSPVVAQMRHHETTQSCLLPGVKRSCGKHQLRSEFDPACVKTHTSRKCSEAGVFPRNRHAARKSMAATCFYFRELLLGTEMHIATWLVAVPWRNSFIGAFSGEFQNLRSDASSGKRTSAVRAPTGQLPSKTSLASTTSSTSPPYLAIAALVLAT